jgi:glycosyltransferase involved in cell wall biosynthesis
MMGMDTPLTGTWRQWLGRFKLAGYVGKMSRVIVPGERAWQYARFLGLPESRIRRGLYGIDFAGLSSLHAARAVAWPKRFLFTGRYTAVKGIDTLAAAYRLYRGQVRDPWPLTCCGQGPLADVLRKTEGVEDRGFVQPADLRQIMLESGVFVLASTYDPWPLVIVEACAAGLPVICTEACGSSVELVRSQFNGLTVASGDATSLAAVMRWTHDHENLLPTMGERAVRLAEPYSADLWAERWMHIMQELRS